MKVLVTGSNGLLGQKLLRLFENDESLTLIATARKSPIALLSRGMHHILDITDSHAVEQTIERFRPDVVVHTAAMTNVDQCEHDPAGCLKNNVDAVSYLVSACERYNIHFIYLSTDFVFDGSRGPLDESAVPSPVNFYGQTKAAAEAIVQAGKLPWTIIRTVLVYGITRDMSRSNIVLWVKQSLEQGKPINVVNDQWRTPTLAEDLATGCYLALKKKATGIFHVSGSETFTPYEIALATASYFNLDQSLITPVSSGFLKQPATRPPRTGFVIEKARRELGYEPHTLLQGLSMLAEQIADRERV